MKSQLVAEILHSYIDIATQVNVQILQRTLTSNIACTENVVGEGSIYRLVRLFQVQLNFSASFQYLKLRNFSPKAFLKVGVTIFINFYRNNDCKSMVCAQCDIPGIFSYVKAKIQCYSCRCIARDVLQEMIRLLQNMVT